jgi:cation diffusion facilitator CzcD-associated flavoprotein CzcO
VFTAIDVYEQRSSPGGLWNHTLAATSDGLFKIPSTNPHVPLELPIKASHGRREFVSPVYDTLEVNIPHPMMAFSDTPFPEDIPLFPGHKEVKAYLEEYSHDILHLVQFGTQVTDVRLHEERQTDGVKSAIWHVDVIRLDSQELATEQYNAVVIANGHYAVPHIPDITGLKDWALQFPGSIAHSKYYRNLKGYAGKKVIVVGSSASGLDIASHLTETCQLPVYQSQKSVSELAKGFTANPNIRNVVEIAEVIPVERKVKFVDDTEIDGIDAIIFCTGYLYSLPFLESLQKNPILEGSMVHGTYEHLFLASHPSLALPALPQKIIPFPVAEAQAAVIARVYSGRLALPSRAKMEEWEGQQMKRRGAPDQFHVMEPQEDGKYINRMIDWAEKADTRKGLERHELGKMPKRWGAKEFWIRERIPTMRRAFMGLGEKRHHVRTFKDLGFGYEMHKENSNGSIRNMDGT